MTRTGTAYFESIEAANRYYAPYGHGPAGVRNKFAAGEIHIGEPPLKEGERAVLNAAEGRYFIESEG